MRGASICIPFLLKNLLQNNNFLIPTDIYNKKDISKVGF